MAVLAGAVLAFQQLTEDRHQAAADRELTRQGQASQRFTQAISQLGSDRREDQLGGIYGLEQIAQQAPDNRLAVAEVLAAYLHRRVPAKLSAEKTPLVLVGELRSRASDVQAVLTVLGRRQVAQDDPPLDLGRLDLRRADLRRADLRRANLSGTDLSGTVLSGATLRGADLRAARLDFGALRGADLSGALLAGADLIGADLTSASLRSADLRHGTLMLALRRETLAMVPGADLSSANLRGADLREADLSDVDLGGARASRSTQWPRGFNWQGAGVLLGG